jgi:large subunit ribosomal protein L4
LSAKYSEGKLFVLDSLSVDNINTKNLVEMLGNFAQGSCFIIDSVVDNNLLKSVRNISNVNIMSQIGLNVIDIIKHDNLLISSKTFHANFY